MKLHILEDPCVLQALVAYASIFEAFWGHWFRQKFTEAYKIGLFHWAVCETFLLSNIWGNQNCKCKGLPIFQNCIKNPSVFAEPIFDNFLKIRNGLNSVVEAFLITATDFGQIRYCATSATCKTLTPYFKCIRYPVLSKSRSRLGFFQSLSNQHIMVLLERGGSIQNVNKFPPAFAWFRTTRKIYCRFQGNCSCLALFAMFTGVRQSLVYC